jgi:hypothetical protein
MEKEDVKEKQKQILLNRFDRSEKWRKPFDDKCLRYYKLFRGVVPKLPKGEEDRSNLHIPYTYSTVDTVRAKILTAILANRPYGSFVPIGQDDVENAENMEKLVDSQLEKSEIYEKFFKLITEVLTYGGCPYETGWRHETKTIKQNQIVTQGDIVVGMEVGEQEVTIWDDPDFQPFSIYDLYPDPEGTSIDDCAWAIRREFVTEQVLKSREEQGLYKITDWENIRAGGEKLNEAKQDRAAAIGSSYENASTDDKGSQRYELLHMWEDSHVTTIINRTEIIRDEENPFWHGKKPLGFAKIDPLNGEFYGVGLVEIIECLQAELNTTRNQRIDNNNIAINRMYMVLKHAGIDPKDLVSRPNGIVWVDTFEDVKELQHQPVDATAFQEETVIKNDIQEATGTYAEARGATPDSKRTATENAIKDRAVSIRFEVKTRLFESYGLKRLLFFYDQLNQQFIVGPRDIRRQTEDGYEWLSFGPENITGRYDYQPAGSAVEPTLDAMNYRQNILTLHEQFKDDPYVKPLELKKKVFQAYGVKDIDKILKTQEEIDQEEQQAIAQQQAMLQQQLMGGGGF